MKTVGRSSTKVVNLHYEGYDVYIGRGGPWGNPWSHLFIKGTLFAVRSRKEAIKQHRIWFIRRLVQEPALLGAFLELRGKVLGCYCKPKACHGDLYVRLLRKLQ